MSMNSAEANDLPTNKGSRYTQPPRIEGFLVNDLRHRAYDVPVSQPATDLLKRFENLATNASETGIMGLESANPHALITKGKGPKAVPPEYQEQETDATWEGPARERNEKRGETMERESRETMDRIRTLAHGLADKLAEGIIPSAINECAQFRDSNPGLEPKKSLTFTALSTFTAICKDLGEDLEMGIEKAHYFDKECLHEIPDSTMTGSQNRERTDRIRFQRTVFQYAEGYLSQKLGAAGILSGKEHEKYQIICSLNRPTETNDQIKIHVDIASR